MKECVQLFQFLSCCKNCIIKIICVLFHHIHPYPPFIPENATKLIVGTLAPPRFTTGDLLDGDVDFCYGTRDGQLWIILDRIFDLQLKFETTDEETRRASCRERVASWDGARIRGGER